MDVTFLVKKKLGLFGYEFRVSLLKSVLLILRTEMKTFPFLIQIFKAFFLGFSWFHFFLSLPSIGRVFITLYCAYVHIYLYLLKR